MVTNEFVRANFEFKGVNSKKEFLSPELPRGYRKICHRCQLKNFCLLHEQAYTTFDSKNSGLPIK